MGIKLHGMEFSPEEVLADLQPHINVYKSDLEQDQRQADELWKRYAAVVEDRKMSQLKLVYLEALRDKISLERAKGRAEGLGLKPDEELDDEISGLLPLFDLI